MTRLILKPGEISRNDAVGNHEWTPMHTNLVRWKPVRGDGPATVWWTLGVPTSPMNGPVFIRVNSCPFVVELNGSGSEPPHVGCHGGDDEAPLASITTFHVAAPETGARHLKS